MEQADYQAERLSGRMLIMSKEKSPGSVFSNPVFAK